MTKVYRNNKIEKLNTFYPAGTGGSITDGNKGDIVVSGGGTVWKIAQKDAVNGNVLSWNDTEWIPLSENSYFPKGWQ